MCPIGNNKLFQTQTQLKYSQESCRPPEGKQAKNSNKNQLKQLFFSSLPILLSSLPSMVGALPYHMISSYLGLRELVSDAPVQESLAKAVLRMLELVL